MVDVLKEKSIEQKMLTTTISRHNEWYIVIVKFKLTGELPIEERKEATKVKKGASWFVIYR